MGEEFKKAYDRKVNLLTDQFLNEFCSDGNIDWTKILEFVSGKPSSKTTQRISKPGSPRTSKKAQNAVAED